MLKALAQWFRQSFSLTGYDKTAIAISSQMTANSQMEETFDVHDVPGHLVPYDENLLERARTLWQFGDWQILASLDRDNLQHHLDRAKLVLLAAAGRLQIGKNAEARQYIQLAQDWGCNKKYISQILISGVHNSIGIAAAIGAQKQRAGIHFEKAISVGSPSSDLKLLTRVRREHQVGQFMQIGLPSSTTCGESIKTINIDK